jgi:hypothetical protein
MFGALQAEGFVASAFPLIPMSETEDWAHVSVKASNNAGCMS